MVEMTIVIPLLLTLVLGFVDFGYAFYQWNAASKAVQVGARLAAISNPIASGLPLEAGAPSNVADVGAPVPSNTYAYACFINGANTLACSCTAGTCANVAANVAAFDRIYGGDDLACVRPSVGRPGMCDFFPGLQRNEVRVEYLATGLGYWTRPGGPVPTIRVSIRNAAGLGRPFQFFFLGGLMNFANIRMPTMISTVTGEDLSATAPS